VYEVKKFLLFRYFFYSGVCEKKEHELALCYIVLFRGRYAIVLFRYYQIFYRQSVSVSLFWVFFFSRKKKKTGKGFESTKVLNLKAKKQVFLSV